MNNGNITVPATLFKLMAESIEMLRVINQQPENVQQSWNGVIDKVVSQAKEQWADYMAGESLNHMGQDTSPRAGTQTFI